LTLLKKLLLLLFSILISFNSYGFFHKTVCVATDAQDRGGIIYLPNKTKPFTGKNLCKYDNGQIESKGKVKDGLRDGIWNSWFGNGDIKFERNYINGKEIDKDGLIIRRYSDDQIMSKGNYINGKYTWWSQLGYKTLDENYKDGNKDGRQVYYDPYGQIRLEEYFENGVSIKSLKRNEDGTITESLGQDEDGTSTKNICF